MSAIAIPLTAALTLEAGAAQIGYLTALTWLPALVFSIPAGVWVDSSGRHKEVMVVSDVARGVLLGAVVALYATHALTLEFLYCAVALKGVFSVFFDVSGTSVFGRLVRPDDYVAAGSLLAGGQQLCALVGPSLGGLLVQILTAPVALAFDAVSYCVSAAFISRLPRFSRVKSGRCTRFKNQLSEGIRFIWGDGRVRAILATTSSVNLLSTFTNTLVIVYVVRNLHFSPSVIGLYYAFFPMGGFIGSLLTTKISRRIGVGRSFAVGCFLYCAPYLIVPSITGTSAADTAALMLQSFVSGFGVVIENVSVGSMFAFFVAEEERSTVRGAFQTVSFGMRPLGALLSGSIAAALGIQTALWIGTIGAALSFLWVVPSPIWRFRFPISAELETA